MLSKSQIPVQDYCAVPSNLSVSRADDGLPFDQAARKAGSSIQANDKPPRRLKEHQFSSQLVGAYRRQEFEVFYQPKVRVSDHEIIGAEALIRWNHPDLGILAPQSFGHHLYHGDLGRSVSYWCLETACKQAARWRCDHVSDFVVSVNTCAAQLSSRDMPARVASILSRTGLPPNALELELTEDHDLDGLPNLPRNLDQLRDMKVGIAVDDFGTGFASLKHILNYPVSRLKIDRLFVASLDKPSQTMRTCASIVEMATKLGVDVTVEGVETQEQLRVLKAIGCTEVQGFLYSRPIPAAQFERLLINGFAFAPA